MKTVELKAVKKFDPGYFILEQMEINQWTLKTLSHKLRIPDSELISILDNENPLSENVAQKLGEIFKTSQEYWLNIDKGYRTWLLL